MLFFRSEEAISRWCEERDARPGPALSMGSLWGLANAWYANRLSADFRRLTLEEVRRLFVGLGLQEEFWDPSPGDALAEGR